MRNRKTLFNFTCHSGQHTEEHQPAYDRWHPDRQTGVLMTGSHSNATRRDREHGAGTAPEATPAVRRNQPTMKPDMHYFLNALEAWCKQHKWDKDLPMTPAFLLIILNDATALKEADRKKLEAANA
jgi:hypothetical protein